MSGQQEDMLELSSSYSTPGPGYKCKFGSHLCINSMFREVAEINKERNVEKEA